MEDLWDLPLRAKADRVPSRHADHVRQRLVARRRVVLARAGQVDSVPMIRADKASVGHAHSARTARAVAPHVLAAVVVGDRRTPGNFPSTQQVGDGSI